MSARRPWLSLTIALTLSACSAIALKRVPGNFKSGSDLECTDSLAYPLVDMSATVLSGLLSVSLISVDRDEGETPTAGLAVGAVAVLAAVSAVYGIHQVARCRRTQSEEGVSAPTNTTPNTQEINQGAQGGRCNDDGSCNEYLRCDAPMQVCVPDDPSEFNN